MLTDRDIAGRVVAEIAPDDPPKRANRRMRYNAVWRLPPGRAHCAIRRRRNPMSTMLYKFPCPICGTEIESSNSVTLDETHDDDGTLAAVRIHYGADVIHECEAVLRPSTPAR